MEIALITITFGSIAAAVCSGLVAWRTRCDERRRSAARVAMLAAAAGGSSVEPPHQTRPIAVSSMFTTAPGAMLAGRPFMAVVVMAVLAVALAGVASLAGGNGVGEATPHARNAPALELVSMRHDRDGATLTVTGLVRNPRGGAPVAGIAAVVYAFDRSGAFIASGRAPLDLTTLPPGDESPFVVSIDGVDDVARYRVSFRTEAGVIRHLDRRAEQMARRPD